MRNINLVGLALCAQVAAVGPAAAAPDDSCTYAPTKALNSQTTETIYPASDVDYFKVVVPNTGGGLARWLEIQTTGNVDTYGYLQNSNCTTTIAQDDDSGSGSNFYIFKDVAPGTYKIKIRRSGRSTIGGYVLRVGLMACCSPSSDKG